jgi:hypothetical protein
MVADDEGLALVDESLWKKREVDISFECMPYEYMRLNCMSLARVSVGWTSVN